MWADTVNIKQAVRHMRGGEHDQPWLMLGNDGRQYVVKFRRTDTCPTLANEIFANMLAVQLDLPVLKMILVNINEQIINTTFELDDRGIEPGLHMATVYVADGFTLDDKIMMPKVTPESIKNLDQVPKFIIFDMMLYNVDRSESNIMLIPNDDETYQYYLIDHGMIFGGYGWNESIKTLEYVWVPSYWNMSKARDISDYRDFITIISNLSHECYSNAAKYMPDEFLPAGQTTKSIIDKLASDDQTKLLNLAMDIIGGEGK